MGGCPRQYLATGLCRQGAGLKPDPYQVSFRFDSKLLDQGPPFLGISFDPSAERLRALLLARKNLKPEIGQPRLHRGISHRFHRRQIELTDNFRWRPLRCKQSPPADGVGKRCQSHFSKSGYVRSERRAGFAIDRIGPYGPGPHQRQLGRSVEREVNLTSDKVRNDGGAATIREEGKMSAAVSLKQLRHETSSGCEDSG